MTNRRIKAWSLAAFTTIMIMFVLPELPFVWGIAGLVGLCLLVFR